MYSLEIYVLEIPLTTVSALARGFIPNNRALIVSISLAIDDRSSQNLGISCRALCMST